MLLIINAATRQQSASALNTSLYSIHFRRSNSMFQKFMNYEAMNITLKINVFSISTYRFYLQQIRFISFSLFRSNFFNVFLNNFEFFSNYYWFSFLAFIREFFMLNRFLRNLTYIKDCQTCSDDLNHTYSNLAGNNLMIYIFKWWDNDSLPGDNNILQTLWMYVSDVLAWFPSRLQRPQSPIRRCHARE